MDKKLRKVPIVLGFVTSTQPTKNKRHWYCFWLQRLLWWAMPTLRKNSLRLLLSTPFLLKPKSWLL